MQGLEKRGNKVVPSEPIIEVTDKLKSQIKRWYKKHHNYPTRKMPKEIINSFKYEHDYDSWTNIFIIKVDSIDEAKDVLDKIHYCWEGQDIYSAYDCTGKAFSDEAKFIKYGDRVVVKHLWNLDV